MRQALLWLISMYKTKHRQQGGATDGQEEIKISEAGEQQSRERVLQENKTTQSGQV